MAVAINIFIFAVPDTTVATNYETKINYYIPSDFSGQAEIMLTDEKGSTIIKKLEACIGKPCSITISADGMNTGVYIYALLLDGKIIKSQKMMIIK